MKLAEMAEIGSVAWLREFLNSLDKCGVITEEELSTGRAVARKLGEWKRMASDLYAWEHVEAVHPFQVPYKGPRRSIPDGYTEISNQSGVSREEWQLFCEKNA